ncbi:MAG: sugar ABC transporter permease, partial [Chloroflexi bacterium]|nr:sugar ABC transporter permease [Chloroflexota bacterium]
MMNLLGLGKYPLDNRRLIGALFLTPALLYILLLVGFPFVLSIAFGFSDVTVGNTDLSYVGFRNFLNVWENDIFRQVFETTIRFTLLSQIFILIFANILAVIFTQDFTGKWFARFIFILPWATPVS